VLQIAIALLCLALNPTTGISKFTAVREDEVLNKLPGGDKLGGGVLPNIHGVREDEEFNKLKLGFNYGVGGLM